MPPLAFPAEPKQLQLRQLLESRRSVAVGDG